jgi:hypothetical protein
MYNFRFAGVKLVLLGSDHFAATSLSAMNESIHCCQKIVHQWTVTKDYTGDVI